MPRRIDITSYRSEPTIKVSIELKTSDYALIDEMGKQTNRKVADLIPDLIHNYASPKIRKLLLSTPAEQSNPVEALAPVPNAPAPGPSSLAASRPSISHDTSCTTPSSITSASHVPPDPTNDSGRSAASPFMRPPVSRSPSAT